MTVASINPQNRPLRGALLMVATGLFFVAMTACVKMVGPGLPAAQSGFLRYFLGLVFLIPMMRPIFQANLTHRQLRLFGMRGVVHTFAVILWFFAMTRITIAEVTAMNYLSPVYVTLGASLFLGERLAARRIIAVLVALCGALLILRPGFREVSDGHIAMLGTAIMLAIGYLIAKRMSDELPPSVVVGMLSITVTLGLAPFAFAVWVTPTVVQLGWLFLVAAFATAGHYTMTMAFSSAPMAVTQPVSFLQLVWATLLGWAIFGEAIDGWVLLGGVVIMASATFITLREAMLKRASLSPL